MEWTALVVTNRRSKISEGDIQAQELLPETSGPKVLFEAKLVSGESPEGKAALDLSDIKAEQFPSLRLDCTMCQ